jgi:ArsR family transcriptional regulator
MKAYWWFFDFVLTLGRIYDIQYYIEQTRYEVMALQKYLENAKVFMAFCDETRLKVLELLRDGEKCAGALLKQVNVGQSTLSHHMRVLVESGIVSTRKRGKWTYYSICEGGRQYAVELLKRLTALTTDEVKFDL